MEHEMPDAVNPGRNLSAPGKPRHALIAEQESIRRNARHNPDSGHLRPLTPRFL